LSIIIEDAPAHFAFERQDQMNKSAEAFRTIGEVADDLDVPKHVLRFWEGKFPQIRPMKRGGGRRYYRPEDLELLRGIRHLLHAEGYQIKGVQKILREQGIDQVKSASRAALALAKSQGARTKRGRGKLLALPSGASTAGDSTLQEAKNAAPNAGSFDSVISAAIRELELVRAILAGKTDAPAADRAPRRAARP
jgi:DNA-binding transcriptional MerR regulator